MHVCFIVSEPKDCRLPTSITKRLGFRKAEDFSCYPASEYYTRKAYFPLCSIMKFLFFLLNKMLAIAFCMHGKINIATAATRAKIFSIVYICSELFHT